MGCFVDVKAGTIADMMMWHWACHYTDDDTVVVTVYDIGCVHVPVVVHASGGSWGAGLGTRGGA